MITDVETESSQQLKNEIMIAEVLIQLARVKETDKTTHTPSSNSVI